MSDPDFFSTVPLFELVDEQERVAIAEAFTTRQVDTGQIVFHQGEAGDEMFLVRSGRVQVFTVTDTGQRMVLAENGPGDVFGEISLLDGGPRTATAVALEAVELLTLDRDALLQMIARHPHIAIDLLGVVGRRLRGTDEILRTQVSRNANAEEEERLTMGQRIADQVAKFGGSWTFIITFGAFLIVWIVTNTWILVRRPVDPFPYILLNLFLSMLAALQAPVIMMSQNRQSAKDRLKADMDYEVNLKAELEIAQLHRKLDHLTERVEVFAKVATVTPPPRRISE